MVKDVRDHRVPLAQLTGRLGLSGPPEYFAWLVRRIGLRDVRVEGTDLVYSSFVPIEQLLKEAVEELKAAGAKPGPCQKCQTWFDTEREDGIFANPVAMQGFVCKACAQKLTAWEYFHDVLRT